MSNKQATVTSLLQGALETQGAGFFLYAGHHPHMIDQGTSLPRFLKPSPLNLIYKPLSDVGMTIPTFGNFGFLDFDAF